MHSTEVMANGIRKFPVCCTRNPPEGRPDHTSKVREAILRAIPSSDGLRPARVWQNA